LLFLCFLLGVRAPFNPGQKLGFFFRLIFFKNF
jgi:hypothetical protein